MSKAEKLSRLTNSFRDLASDSRETIAALAAVQAEQAKRDADDAAARAQAEVQARIDAAVAEAVAAATKPVVKTADDILAETRLGTVEHALATFEKHAAMFGGRDEHK